MQVVLPNARVRKASTAFPSVEAFLGLVSVHVLDAKLKSPFVLRAAHDGQEVLRSAVVHEATSGGGTFAAETVLWMLRPASAGLQIEARDAHRLLGALVVQCDLAHSGGATLKKWCPLFRGRKVTGELLLSVTFRISEEGRQRLALAAVGEARSLAARRAAVLGRPQRQAVRVLPAAAESEGEGPHDGGYCTPSLDVRLGADRLPDDQHFNGENSRFQQLLDEIASAAGDHEDLVPLYQEVHTIAQDFLEMATFYGHVIISELHLPIADKTIKPSEGLGGVLGGQKFLVHNILFKSPDARVFADYPDPLWASMKVAGHELKGMQCLASYFFDKGAVGAHLPMAALIDSRGHRLLAISALPISGATLMYGTDSAATTCDVRQTDEALRGLVTEACLHLGLKMHSVVDGYDAETHAQVREAEIASPIDLEGHKAADGRFYLVDCSRLMPPLCKSSPAPHDTCWPYYAAMRPEYLISYPEPLNPDAFSRFCSRSTQPQRDQLEQDVRELREAATHFREVHLPQVARAVLGYWVNGGQDEPSFSLKKKLHINGVNARFLGTMIVVMRDTFGAEEMAQGAELMKRYECEALARAGKNVLRARLRAAHAQQQSSGSSHLVREAVAFLNAFAGSANVVEWRAVNGAVEETLRASFDLSGAHLEAAVATFLEGHVHHPPPQRVAARALVLEQLCEMVGVAIAPEVLEGLRQGCAGSALCLAAPDVALVCRVKHLSVVDRAAGFVLFRQGLAAREAPTRAGYLRRAQQRLVAALDSAPFDARALALAGDINLQHLQLETDPAAARQRAQRAQVGLCCSCFFCARTSLSSLAGLSDGGGGGRPAGGGAAALPGATPRAAARPGGRRRALPAGSGAGHGGACRRGHAAHVRQLSRALGAGRARGRAAEEQAANCGVARVPKKNLRRARLFLPHATCPLSLCNHRHVP